MITSENEIYLDANATTPVLPAAVKEAHEAMQAVYGNPSSAHISGLRAKNILESTRDLVSQVLGAEQGQIIFTSGATESIQLGIFSALCQVRNAPPAPSEGKQRLLLYGATEHKAVPLAIEHWNHLLCTHHRVLSIPVDRAGRLDLDFLREHIPLADLVCTMAVNNETGVITDLASVERAIRDGNSTVPWLVDCVQAVGKLDLQLGKTTIDYAPVSGHKVYAPKGIGLLYARRQAPIVPLFAGGGQEHGARGGTENLPGVAAIAAVFRILAESPHRTFAKSERLYHYRDRIVACLKRAFPSIVFNAPFEHCVPTTINFSVKGFTSKELMDLFDAAGVRVSSGSACGSSLLGSYVLTAMGLPKWQSEGAIRLSFGPLATIEEIDLACQRIEQAGRALCESCWIVSPNARRTREPLDGLVQLKSGSVCTWLWMDSEMKHCVLINPYRELTDRILSLVRCQTTRVKAILDTHGQVDDPSYRDSLLAELGEWALPSAMTKDPLGWPAASDGVATLCDGTQVPYISLSSELVLAGTDLPGYTKDSRGYLIGRLDQQGRFHRNDVLYALTGDTILIGGLGRTDLACSDPVSLYHSLRRLSVLISDRSLICPTHDYNNDFVTTLEAEKKWNPLLASLLDSNHPMSVDEFVRRKTELDATIQDRSTGETLCGKIVSSSAGIGFSELRPQELKSFFAEHRSSLLIDVREPHEFVFSLDWHSVGFESPPNNIPLSQLVGRLPELKSLLEAKGGDLIFICRSGKRSGKAAEIARRLGLQPAFSIVGGLALATADSGEQTEECLDAGFVI